MELMGITEATVLDVVAEPELEMPNDPPHPDGRKFVGRGIAVAVAVDGSILTVLWHGADGRRPDGGPDFALAS